MNMSEFMRRFMDLEERIGALEGRCQTLAEERDAAVSRLDVLDESIADLRKGRETLRIKHGENTRPAQGQA